MSTLSQEDPIPPPASSDLETLRQILLVQDRARLEALLRELEALRARSEDPSHTLELIEPLLTEALGEQARVHPQEMAEAIRPALIVGLQRQVQEERDSLINILTPIIGRTVQRAIAEAMAALARQVDTRMQRVLDVGSVWRRFQARVRGVDEAALALREALPWTPQHVFLISSGSGLVLTQASGSGALEDPEMVAALLTAIRSFARESFRGEPDESLHEIQFGDRQVLLEEGQYSYIALVGQGVPPANLFQLMRESLALVHVNELALVRDFNGDAGAADVLTPYLQPLLMADVPAAPPENATRGLVLLAAALLGLLLACGWLTYRLTPRVLAHLAPTAVLYLAPPTATVTHTPSPSPTASPSGTPTPTPSPTPSATPSPTPTSSPTPTPSATATPTSTPRPAVGLMIGSVYVRSQPDPEAPLSNLAMRVGERVRVLAESGLWLEVAYPAEGAIQLQGWVPGRWVRRLP